MVLATPAATLAAILDELFNLIESFTPQYKATMGAIDQDWPSSVGYLPFYLQMSPSSSRKKGEKSLEEIPPKLMMQILIFKFVRCFGCD